MFVCCTEKSGLAVQKRGADKAPERDFSHCLANESSCPFLPGSRYHACCLPEYHVAEELGTAHIEIACSGDLSSHFYSR